MFKNPIEKLSLAAAKARQNGDTCFVPEIPNASNFAPAISAIEAQGWRLEHWDVGSAVSGFISAYPVFRRA
ncbi:hypothetical protein C5O27_10310 [Gordonia alkanivorans]|uniref:hypothetical protein n=1 Tax=Gordonia alkanivorans TaxID=84096 RepID=UPI000FDD2A70|nr:hypothetical protein [Gordonia alkanivorans]AZZ81411.1 hypothetical protein C5O27_10310 [Gordonia alkanivorans]